MNTTKMDALINRLQGLPEDIKKVLAPSLNEYLNKLEDLRDTIESSKNSGAPISLSKDALLQRIHKKNAPQM